MTNIELKARLEDIGKRIQQTKDQLRKHRTFNENHQITHQELDDRYRMLKSQLNKEVSSLEAVHHQIGELEREFLYWMNSINFDSEPPSP